MNKKLLSLAMGFALLSAGLLPPVLAATTNQATTSSVQVNDNLTVVVNGTATTITPFGVTGDIVALTPSSSTVSAKATAGVDGFALTCGGAGVNADCGLVDMSVTTNAVNGVTIAVSGVDGLLGGATNIANSGAPGADLGGTCIAAENTSAFTGLAIRQLDATATNHDAIAAATANELVSSASFATAGAITTYGADTSATTRLYCHMTGANLTFAATSSYNETAQLSVADFIIGLLAGVAGQTTGEYAETITFTFTTN